MSDLVQWLPPEPLPIAPNIDALATAYHEAGHACGGYLHFGWPFELLELAPDGRSGSLTPTPGINKDPVSYAIACLAGPLAEARFIGEADWFALAMAVGLNDLNMAREALCRLPDAPSLHRVAAQANLILTTKWKAVERVAFELVEHRCLTYREVQRAVSRW